MSLGSEGGTDLFQRRSVRRSGDWLLLRSSRRIHTDDRLQVDEWLKIVEFGPLLAFTACLMNFEKLAHGSPQWTQGAQTHTFSFVLRSCRSSDTVRHLTETRYNLQRLQSDELGEHTLSLLMIFPLDDISFGKIKGYELKQAVNWTVLLRFLGLYFTYLFY